MPPLFGRNGSFQIFGAVLHFFAAFFESYIARLFSPSFPHSLSPSLSPTLSFQGMVFPHYTFLTHSFSLPFALLVLSVSLLFFFIFILYYIELLYFDLHLQRLYLCLYVLMYICTYVCMHPCLYVTMSLCTYGYM